MTPEAVQIPDPDSAQMGTFARISGVFFEPGKTFADIGRKPGWFVPLLLAIVSGLAFYAAYGQKVGWERYIDQQIVSSPRMQQQMEGATPEQRAMQAKFTGIGFYVGPFIGIPVVMAISAALMMAMLAIMSAGLKFKQVFAIACFAGLPMAVKNLLSVVVVFLKNPDDINVMNPLPFNFAYFMDPVGSSKFLYTIATALDLFAIWVIVLTAIGLAAAAGRKKLSFGGAMVAVLVPWVVFVCFGAAMAAMFS